MPKREGDGEKREGQGAETYDGTLAVNWKKKKGMNNWLASAIDTTL